MKKLLSLLSVLTISGSAVPTTIAASPHQKEETIKNSDNNINYQQSNNIKEIMNLDENSEINYQQTENKIFEKKESQVLIEYSNFKNDETFKTPRLYVNWNANDYFDKLKKQILKSLLDNGIILNLNNTGGTSYFAINNTQFNSFIIPISVERDNQSINIDLVFRLSDFYFQGFSYDTTYYHFSDSTITSINGQTSRNLNFDSNYNTLIGDSDPLISWSGIEQAFNDLINYGENPGNNPVIRGALARVILATAESMRFRRVRENIERTYNQNVQLSWRDDFYSIITNWSRTTNQAIDYLREHGNQLTGFTHNSNILIFTVAILNFLNACKNTLKNEETCYEVKMRPLEIYYYDNKNNKKIRSEWFYKPHNYYLFNFNLGKINPIDFKKIKILYKNNKPYTKISWGNQPYYGQSIEDYFIERYNNFHSTIKNKEIITESDIDKNAYYTLQDVNDYWWPSYFEGFQKFGLSYYRTWENNRDNYYLQIFIHQYAHVTTETGGEIVFDFGNGLKLYND